MGNLGAFGAQSGIAGGLGNIMGGSMGGGGGNYSEASANALTLYSLNKAEELKKQLLGDPLLSALEKGATLSAGKMAGMEFLGAGKALGQQQADLQTQAVTAALAGRGGGGLGSALSAGAKARTGAVTQGLFAGIEAQKGYGDILAQSQNVLAQALTNKYNLLTQIFAKQMGVQAPYVGYQGQLGSAETGAQAQMWSAMLSALGGIGAGAFGKGG